jgi:hypothetical protein
MLKKTMSVEKEIPIIKSGELVGLQIVAQKVKHANPIQDNPPQMEPAAGDVSASNLKNKQQDDTMTRRKT